VSAQPQVSLPRWLAELERMLPIRSQFVVSGNIRDSFLTDMGGATALAPLVRALWERLYAQGYRCLLVYDPADGIRIYPNEPELRSRAERLFDLKLGGGAQMVSLETLASLMKNLVAQREVRCALVLDFASRMTRQPDHLAEGEHRFFVAAEKLSLTAAPVVPKEGGGVPLFNPVLWLLNRAAAWVSPTSTTPCAATKSARSTIRGRKTICATGSAPRRLSSKSV
jgi:hypothetical protein